MHCHCSPTHRQDSVARAISQLPTDAVSRVQSHMSQEAKMSLHDVLQFSNRIHSGETSHDHHEVLGSIGRAYSGLLAAAPQEHMPHGDWIESSGLQNYHTSDHSNPFLQHANHMTHAPELPLKVVKAASDATRAENLVKVANLVGVVQGTKRKALSSSNAPQSAASGETATASAGGNTASASEGGEARPNKVAKVEVQPSVELAMGEHGKAVETLHTLSAMGDSDAVKTILTEHGVQNVNCKSSSGHTALEYALINGHEDVALALLEAGATDPWAHKGPSARAPSHSGSALHKAVVLASPTVAQALLARSPHLAMATNRHGETPMHIAARVGQVVTLTLLVNVLKERHEAFEAAMAQDLKGNTPLHEAAANSEREAECVKLLLGCNRKVVSMVNTNGQTPLHRAAISGQNLKAVEELLGADADATLPDVDGLKPARLAHIHGHNEIAQLLAQAYVDRLAANKSRDNEWKKEDDDAEEVLSPIAAATT